MTQNTPTKHSLFSPSGSGRWMKCPGSIPFVQSLNLPHRDSEFALEGTACHELAAECLINGDIDASSYIGREFIPRFPVDMEMVNSTNTYLDYVRGFMTLSSVMEVEQRIEMNDLHEGTGGTSDVVMYSPKEFHCFDLKYGRGVPVDVVENSQMMLYTAGRIRELHQAGIIDANQLERISIHIVQPRCPHPDGPCRSWDVPIERLREHWRNAKIAIQEALSDNPPFNPGESQCKWCDGAPVCRKLTEFNLKTAMHDFESVKSQKLALMEANKMSKEEIAEIMKHSGIFETWINSIVAYAQNELERGRGFPGYKLVRGRSIRGWANNAQQHVIKVITDLGFSEKEAYSEPKFRSPNQIEQLIGKKNAAKLSEYVVKPLGKITIAPESDKRDAVDPKASAASDFESFTPEGDLNDE